MQYEDFQKRINALVNRIGGYKPTVRFSHSDGKHYARFSDGTMIIGNTVAKNFMVRWGSGHAAYALI